MTKEERRVIKAALGCVDKYGFAYRFARVDANLFVIDRAKFRRLEKAVADFRAAKRNR